MRVTTFGCFAALCLAAMAQAQQARDAVPQELEEIVVVGRVPGPPLWKVTSGEHVLWILPLIDFYPRRMEWDSTRVEALIAQSQEYIARPRTTQGFSVSNPLVAFRVLNLMTTSMQLPRGKTLSKVLPPELYPRFKALKSHYFPRNFKIDNQTVAVATETLRDEILEHENLEMFFNSSQFSPAPIMGKVSEALKVNKSIRQTWPVTGSSRHMTRKEFKAAARAMEESLKSPAFQSWATRCMEEVIAFFEGDLDATKRHANAWARGQLKELLAPSPAYPTQGACRQDPFTTFFGDGPRAGQLRKDHPALYADLTPDREALIRQSRDRWLAAAETALGRSASTFSMLRLQEILAEDGLVEQLRARGYAVEISAE